MKKEVQIAWVKALRSGEYKQCSAVLAKVDAEGQKSFCCLGVLCTLAEEAGVTQGVKLQDGNLGLIVSWDEAKDILPNSVMEWAGLSSTFGKRCDGKEVSLAMMNDEGRSFISIAATIEEEGHVL